MQSTTVRPPGNRAGMENDEDFEVDWVLLFDFEDLGMSQVTGFRPCVLLNDW